MTTKSAKQIFDFFPGIWKLSRRTFTPLKQWKNSGGECINAVGYAAIVSNESDPNLLVYSEKVTIKDASGKNEALSGMEARQKYKYRFDPQADTLTKYFFDDRLFYKLDVDETKQTNGLVNGEQATVNVCGEHLCIQDNYLASYGFNDSGNNYTMTYSVSGPKKCYEITTDYEKCSEEELNELGIRVVNDEIV